MFIDYSCTDWKNIPAGLFSCALPYLVVFFSVLHSINIKDCIQYYNEGEWWWYSISLSFKRLEVLTTILTKFPGRWRSQGRPGDGGRAERDLGLLGPRASGGSGGVLPGNGREGYRTGGGGELVWELGAEGGQDAAVASATAEGGGGSQPPQEHRCRGAMRLPGETIWEEAPRPNEIIDRPMGFSVRTNKHLENIEYASKVLSPFQIISRSKNLGESNYFKVWPKL